jgi:uncharacterized protein (TIGR02145 family)
MKDIFFKFSLLFFFSFMSFLILSQKKNKTNQCEIQQKQLVEYADSVKNYKSRLLENQTELSQLNSSITELIRTSNLEKQLERKIGNQIWSADNLKVAQFNDGGKIAFARSKEEWDSCFSEKIPAYCFFKDDTTGSKGFLYNYYAFSSEKLAPIGWRIPNQNDIIDLNKSFAKDSIHTAIYFKSSEVGTWKNPGNDLFNMNIKPFGFRLSDSKEWYSGSKIYFACQSNDSKKFAIIVLTEFNDDIFINEKEIETENYGLYVRCIKQ